MMFIEDGLYPQWQKHLDHPRLEYKHLERDKFEELLDLMMEAHPEHELTEWLKRGYAMNEGDSTITFASLQGHRVLQWTMNHFDEEDAESYEMMFGEEEEMNWDDDWDD
jgi:hypothetical protein